MSATKLTAKQQRFVDLYDGNGVEAARLAGYSGSDNALGVMAAKLLRTAHVASAIRAREEKRQNPLIANREERQAFWTKIMRGPSPEDAMNEEGELDLNRVWGMEARLKASELLGKSEADFTDKTEHSGSGPVIISINGIAADPPKKEKQ